MVAVSSFPSLTPLPPPQWGGVLLPQAQQSLCKHEARFAFGADNTSCNTIALHPALFLGTAALITKTVTRFARELSEFGSEHPHRSGQEMVSWRPITVFPISQARIAKTSRKLWPSLKLSPLSASETNGLHPQRGHVMRPLTRLPHSMSSPEH